MQKAFIFDIDRCTGCQACQLACSIENQVAPEMSWRQITTFNPQHHPAAASFHLSLACNHCLDAPCMKSCPASAYTKDAATGAVTIDPDSCIGCKYCAWACPYDAPQFNERAGVMEKCTFCSHRLAEGKTPSCVTACPTGALQFGDYSTAFGSGDAPGFPRANAEPALRFVNPRSDPPAPARGDKPLPELRVTAPASKIRLRSEWSLVVFTLLAAVLVAWVVAGLGGVTIHPLGFGVLAVASLIVSTSHLGQRRRAWRAVLNWRTSWVSREIITYSLFLGASALHVVTGQHERALLWLSVLCGAMAVLSMDRVYSVTATRGLTLHSARVLFMAVFLAGVIANEPVVFLTFGAIRGLLYVARRIRFAANLSPAQWALSGARILFGLALPFAWTTAPSGGAWIPLAAVLVGELIDRAEFYTELDISTPRRQAVADLTAAVRSLA